MRILILIAITILAVGCGNKGVKEPELKERGEYGDEIAYIKGSDTPYTGTQIGYWKGEKESETNYKDGKKDGPATVWYSSGEKQEEVNYKDGKRDGLDVFWYPSGQKLKETNWKDGVPVSQKYWNSKGEPDYSQLNFSNELKESEDQVSDTESKKQGGNRDLCIATMDGTIEEVRELLVAGADVNEKEVFPYGVPLCNAVKQGHKEMVELLISNGAKLETKNFSDRTPLMLAIEGGHKEIVELLISKGVDLEAKDNGGNNSLDLAILREKKEIAEILRKNGIETRYFEK